MISSPLGSLSLPAEGHSGRPFPLQNHLLEVGWNKSEATQKDVEKTLNCCGFSSFDSNSPCAAVSQLGLNPPCCPCFSTKDRLNCPFKDDFLSSSASQACFHSSPSPSCPTCSSIMQEHAGQVLQFVGGIGLFFSFTEVGKQMHIKVLQMWDLNALMPPQIFGVWLAHRYRNTKDPRSNPGAFL